MSRDSKLKMYKGKLCCIRLQISVLLRETQSLSSKETLKQ